MEKWEISQKILNRSCPKFCMGDYFETPTAMQNFITIRLPPFDPNMRKCATSDSTGFLFWFFRQPTAKTHATSFTVNSSIYQYTMSNNRAVDGHQMYSAGSTIDPENHAHSSPNFHRYRIPATGGGVNYPLEHSKL